MAVYERIVVGTDGSETARRAVVKAAVLAGHVGAPLTIGTAYHRPDPAEAGPASERSQQRHSGGALAFQGASDTAGDSAGLAQSQAGGVKVSTAVREGDPADVLIDLAAERDPSLLVVGNKGMTGSGRFLLGSVPNKVSHHAVSDVLISRTDLPASAEPPRRIVVGTDGSKTATRAVSRAVELAGALGADLTGLYVGSRDSRGERVLEEASLVAADADVTFTGDLRAGDPAEQLVAVGADHDLVVVGNKGMAGASRFLLGSVPNKVSHHIGTDLLIVRTVA